LHDGIIENKNAKVLLSEIDEKIWALNVEQPAASDLRKPGAINPVV
jgi:hypothetical protein